MKLENEELFEYWLFDMDNAIEKFFLDLGPDLSGRLDFSPASLDQVEQWILGKYPDTAAMLPASEKNTVDGLARYVGETYRKELGGTWEIRFDDPKYAYYGIPQLSFGKKSTPVSPHALVTTVADRRTGSFLRTVLENSKKRNSMNQDR